LRAMNRRVRFLALEDEHECRVHLERIGVDPYGVRAMLPKTRHLKILVEGVPCKVANILKQEMLSLGGDAAVARQSVSCSIPETDCLLMGTRKQLDRLLGKLRSQPFGMEELGRAIEDLIRNVEAPLAELVTARRRLVVGDRTLVMGILNVTPDSFSDGGRYYTPAEAVARGLEMAAEGADLIDVGGESSRPGADPVPEDEELRRIIPVVEGLAAGTDVPLSIDTTKAAVARAALAAGAEIINDISAMTFDRDMAKVAAETGAGVILMHMRGRPKDMQAGDLAYEDLLGEIIGFLRERIAAAGEAGIPEEALAVDPGIGFGKTAGQNLTILKRLSEFRSLGRPVVVGVSRKSFLGAVTGETEPAERREETSAAVALAAALCPCIVRVHDVAAGRKAAAVGDAVRKA